MTPDEPNLPEKNTFEEAKVIPAELVHPARHPMALDQPGLEGPLKAFLSTAVDSEHTRRAYRRHIRDAFGIMGASSPGDVTLPRLADYRETLMDDGRGAATHAQALSALRSFLNWCADLGGLRIPTRPVERLLRVPRATVTRPYVTLTTGEVERLLEASGTSLRDQALVLVMLGGGLRVSELSGLDCTDLVQVDGEPVLYVRKAKGTRNAWFRSFGRSKRPCIAIWPLPDVGWEIPNRCFWRRTTGRRTPTAGRAHGSRRTELEKSCRNTCSTERSRSGSRPMRFGTHSGWPISEGPGT